MTSQHATAQRFRDLHHGDHSFVLPNPWDPGTAKILAAMGYEALATTSAGFAHSRGRPDGGLTRHEVIAHSRDIVAATDLPVSADLENGFGRSPEEVAITIAAAAEVGLAGCSIEDASGDDDQPIYEIGLARDRIAAAAAAVAGLEAPFVLTARCENFLWGNPDLDDTVDRLQAYQEAGAEVLYAPGLADLKSMGIVVAEVDLPVNLLADPRYTLAELRSTGAKRISLGSSLSRTALGAFVAAAQEYADTGTMGFATGRPRLQLNRFFDGGTL